MKTCKKCNIEKEMNLFKKHKNNKDGHSNSCKECDNIYIKEYQAKNKDKVPANQKEWRDKNKESIKEYNSEYKSKNKEHLDIMDKIWRDKNKEHLQEYYKEREKNTDYISNYYIENKDLIKERSKEYYENNKESIKDKRKIYCKNNRFKINERIKYCLDNDPLFKLKFNIRSSIRKSFIIGKKSLKTTEILGCSFEEFKLHLESRFEDWMTWDNRGLYNGELNYGWDIDHIIPLASAETEEDIIRLNHYTNLQPLCSRINRDIKRDRLDYNIIKKENL